MGCTNPASSDPSCLLCALAPQLFWWPSAELAPVWHSCTERSPKQHLWDRRKAQYKVFENGNFCPLLSTCSLLSYSCAKHTMSIYCLQACCWYVLSIRDLSAKLLSSQLAPTSAAAVGYPVAGALFGTCFCGTLGGSTLCFFLNLLPLDFILVRVATKPKSTVYSH